MTELPTGWVDAPLTDLCSVIRGVTFQKREALTTSADGTIPLITSTHISGGTLNLTTDLSFVPARRVSELQKLRRGDIVVAASSGSASVVGKSALLMSDWFGSFGAFCSVLRAVEGVEPAYLGYFVRSPHVRRLWSALAAGTNINNLKRDHFAGTMVPLAPLAEQRRIVAAIEEQLSRLDTAERLLRRAVAALKSLRAAAIESAFSPEWPQVPLGEIANVVGGVTKDSKRQLDPAFVEVPYLRVANVQRGYLDLGAITTIRVPPATAAALELKPGDVLFNEGGDRDKLGRGWVWSGEVPSCIHQNHVFRARVQEGFEPRFVSWWGNTFGREWFWRHGRQTTNLASMSLSTLKTFPVPSPTLAEQRAAVDEIDRRLDALGYLTEATSLALRRAEALRGAILTCAFRGQLVPQDPDEEAASVLLNRIAAQRATGSNPKRARWARTPA